MFPLGLSESFSRLVLSLQRSFIAVVARLLGLSTVCENQLEGKIVYWVGGEGEPLVLLHGIGVDKSCFLMAVRHLRHHYRLIIPDLPGFGTSVWNPAEDFSVEYQCERLLKFFDALDLKTFHLLGHSMGGLLAGAFCAQHPSRVLSLCLVSPAGVKSSIESEMMSDLNAERDLPIFASTIAETKGMLAFVMAKPPPVPSVFLRGLAWEQRKNRDFNRRVVNQLKEGPWLDEMIALQPDMPRTLIIWGERDRAVDASGANTLHELVSDSVVRLMPETGHAPMVEQCRLFCEAYVMFQNS